jgi:hypothetical protein
MRAPRIIAALGVVALGIVLAHGARADAIDGDWCSADGRSFSIKGSEIVTPAGTHSRGNYSRHAFSYIVPESDPGAGEPISMLLVNEMTVQLWTGDARPQSADAVETWHRCPPPVSAARHSVSAA